MAALDEQLSRGRARLWRLPTEEAVRATVGDFNRLIADYNTVTGLEPRPLLDADAHVATWRRLDLAAD